MKLTKKQQSLIHKFLMKHPSVSFMKEFPDSLIQQLKSINNFPGLADAVDIFIWEWNNQLLN
jgi:hypothetical protein